MKRISLPLCLQASALALPLAFLVAGGCGGGNNGVTVPPPVVLGAPTPIGGFMTPTPTAIPGTTPVPTATTDPTATPSPTATVDPSATPIPTSGGTATPTPTSTATPTPTPTSGGTHTPNLNFSTFVADGPLLRINDRMSSELFIRVDNGVRLEGQTVNALGTAAFPRAQSGVDYIEGLGQRVWEATGGTITILRFRAGTVGAGQPGEYSVRLNNVQMAPFRGTTATGTFVLNGTYTATSGTVN